MKSHSKLWKPFYFAVLLLLIAIFLFSAYMLIRYYSESQKSKQTYQALSDLRSNYTRPATESLPQDHTGTEPSVHLATATDPDTGLSTEVLPELAALYSLNPDLVGWLSIPGTIVDYPVVQRKSEKDYYLYRDFYGNSSSYGCLYAQEDCDVSTPSDNVIIYGHRMKDQSMFGQLGSYEKEDFWQEHQFLYFDTLTERHTYQVICVFSLSTSNGTGFPYHLFVEAASKEAFQTYLENCAAHQLYDTGLTAQYGDKLLSLSTCEYSHEGGRLVVVAKRID